MKKSLEDLARSLAQFAAERDWEQFHSPKNLAMALSVEAGEILEHFQWLTEAQSDGLDDASLEAVGEEIADVQIYLLLLANRLGIDVTEVAERKISKNRSRFPAEEVRGRAKNRPVGGDP